MEPVLGETASRRRSHPSLLWFASAAMSGAGLAAGCAGKGTAASSATSSASATIGTGGMNGAGGSATSSASGGGTGGGGPMTSAVFTPTTEDFPNPERGFFYPANGGLLGGAQFASDLDSIKSDNYRLAYTITNIGAYKTQNIPQADLDTMSANLGATRTKGMKLIVRFAYDYSGATDPDTSLAWVMAHTQQLAPILEANKDVIAYVQAGFIGQWGEWHDSGASGLDSKANKKSVKDAVLAMVPVEIPVQFTQVYPMQEDWYPTPLGAGEAFDGSQKARSGFHNDCFMSSANDRFTYPGANSTIIDFTTTKSELEERQYVAALTEYAPFGGETCEGAPDLRLSCTGSTDGAGLSGGILNEGPRYHLTYLNRGYYPAFEDQWTTEGCFDTVSRSMGYRFQLDGVSHPESASPGQTVTVNVSLRNVGWSRIFSARPLVVTLVNGSTTYAGASTMLLRQLPSQATSSTTIPVSIAIPNDAPTGSYQVYFSVPDVYPTTQGSADYAVRFANADAGGQAWDASLARFSSGTVLTLQ